MKVIITTTEETVTVSYDPRKRSNQVTARDVIENPGFCRVEYRRSEFNEFEFNSPEEFRSKFAPCVEPELLRFLGVRYAR